MIFKFLNYMKDTTQMHRQIAKERVVIVHNHVLKNAGSTIDWALHRNFGKCFVDHRDNKNMQKKPDYLAEYLTKNQNIRVLSTHHLRLPLPLLNNLKMMTIMMFRHPIERVMSVYNFERKQTPTDTLGARFARNHSLREYILWRMRFDVPPTIRNFHVYRTLPTPIRWQEEAGNSELMKAKAYVDSLEMLGFVERFDESMILFEKVLDTIYPGIDLSYKTQNVGQQTNDSQELRIERLRKEIGDEAYNLLIDRNQADLELYNYAQRIFENRLNQIISIDAKIDNLRKRCKSLLGNN